MGNEYALKVIHIDNAEPLKVKVIYPYFENTLSKWLKKLHPPNETDEYVKWMRAKVFPKIRKLWQILLKMKDNGININKPYCMPLINGVPKLLYIHEEDGEKNKGDTPDDGFSSSNQGQNEQEPPSFNQEQNNDKDKDKNNLDLDYLIEVLNGIVTKLRSDGSYELRKYIDELHKYIEELQVFWKSNQDKSEHPQHYHLLSMHPILYNSDEKSKFLQLFYDVTWEYGLSSWLDMKMHWGHFQSRMMSAKKRRVYEATLHHKSRKSQNHAYNRARGDQGTHSSSQGYELNEFKRRRIHGNPLSSHAHDQEQSDLGSLSSNQRQSDQKSLSFNQEQSNQKTPYYCRGSDVVRFTRNVLAHFNDNDKNPKGERLAGDEIVETVDRDLAVCSLYYTYAKQFIADQATEELIEGYWKNYQQERWDNLKDEILKKAKKRGPGQKEAQLISQAYQLVPLQLYVRTRCQPGKWMKAEEIFKRRPPT
ncbi:hypothetical protein SLEP1_g55719 [Rubroshorea leprosula]|nr:hypothetical protein SLEP1_g55719 [Rubroshorea leprosula]